MKILFLMNDSVSMYNFRMEIVEMIKEKGHSVYVSLPDGPKIKEIEDSGCNIIITPFDKRGTNPIKDIAMFGRYIKIIKQIGPDIILSYTIKPNIYGSAAAKICKVPVIVNITGLGSSMSEKNLLSRFIVAAYKIAAKNWDCVFFQNKDNMEFFERCGIKPRRKRLIPGSGVNLTHYKILQYPGEETTEFVFAARILKEKGIDEYLECAKYIKKKYPNTKFHVCGFCVEEYQDILKKMTDEGIIIYHGLVMDMREILKNVHCTVHPSYYPEGMSNVLLESCACGRPIITTDETGCREVLDIAKNGYVIEPRNAAMLIETVEKFIAMPWDAKKRMGLNARRKVEHEFDRRIVVKAYKEEMSRLKEGF